MGNPLIEVTNATYGCFDIKRPIDVTENIQQDLDKQYADNKNITYFIVNAHYNTWVKPIPDPFPGKTKSLVITYVHLDSGCSFTYATSEKQKDIYINVEIPKQYYWTAISAVYGSPSIGIDLTSKFQKYFADPMILSNAEKLKEINNLQIGTDSFFKWFTNGQDPDPGVTKHLALLYITDDDGPMINAIRSDGDKMSLWW